MKCRLCLIECHKENEVSLFSNDRQKQTNLTKLIAKYMHIEVTQEDSFSTIICKYCVRHLNDFHDFFQLVEKQQQVLQKEDFLEAKRIITDIDKSLLDKKDVLVEDELNRVGRLLSEIFAYDEHLNNVAGSDDEENIPLQSLRRKTANETASNEKKKRPMRKKKLISSIKRKYRSLKRKKKLISSIKRKYRSLKRKNDKESNRKEPTKKLLTPEENKLRKGLVTIVHKEKRYHICDICEKGFKSSVLLKVHIEHKHGKRAKFVCETCGKEYRKKLFFDRHVATDKCQHVSYAHGKKIFSCTYCEKTFKKQLLLKGHVAIHTGRKDYSCQYCTREFCYKHNMNAHIKKFHAEEWASDR